jgi:pyridoxal phosphate enzyme (YggS family)
MESIALNIAAVKERIAAAARKSGRPPESVLLLGVTKTVDTDRMREAAAAGVACFGENKIQEIVKKYPEFADRSDIEWHMIGHLQTNKVKFITNIVSMIHSVDSLKLGREIGAQFRKAGRVADALIEINISGEESKFGVAPEDAAALARELSNIEGIRPRGLMCVAPFVENPEENRKYFQKMREILIDINKGMFDNNIMEHLSMGMTNDYAVAVEEGATIARVGAGIFGAREYS